jgi:hypothetical protein
LGVVVLLRAPILLHRWLGVAFCLLFAMWFASGIVMHFLPYPSFSPIDLAGSKLHLRTVSEIQRARLTQRSDGPIYLISNSSATIAPHTTDLSAADEVSAKFAGVIASDYAIRRQ